MLQLGLGAWEGVGAGRACARASPMDRPAAGSVPPIRFTPKTDSASGSGICAIEKLLRLARNEYRCAVLAPSNTGGHASQVATTAASWIIYKLASRQTWLGEIETANEAEAVKKSAAEFNTRRS
jgi:hypothetical protein